MKRMKKITILTMIFAFIMHSISFASTRHVTLDEYDPRTMTLEERSKWVDENVPATYYSSYTSPISPFGANGEWIYTSTKTSSVGPSQYTVGKLTTRVKYTVNASQYSVEDWATEVFRARSISAYGLLTDTNIDSCWMDEPGNYRIIYQAWFADPSGAHFIEHWYNLHGNGNYSLRVVNGGDNTR